MKIILNSITFALLIQKLWNNKHAHHLVKHTANQKWGDGYMIWESYNMIMSKQNKHFKILLNRNMDISFRDFSTKQINMSLCQKCHFMTNPICVQVDKRLKMV
jgi:hypothetical protein